LTDEMKISKIGLQSSNLILFISIIFISILFKPLNPFTFYFFEI
jgi:hypothetical protein